MENNLIALSNLDSFLEELIPPSSISSFRDIPPIEMSSLIPEIPSNLSISSSVDPLADQFAGISLNPFELPTCSYSTSPTVDLNAPTRESSINGDEPEGAAYVEVNSARAVTFRPQKRRQKKSKRRIAVLDSKYKELEGHRRRDGRQLQASIFLAKNLDYKSRMQEKELLRIRLSAIHMREKIKVLEKKLAIKSQQERIKQNEINARETWLIINQLQELKKLFPNEFKNIEEGVNGEQASGGGQAKTDDGAPLFTSEFFGALAQEFLPNSLFAKMPTFFDPEEEEAIRSFDPVNFSKISELMEDRRLHQNSETSFDFMKRHGWIDLDPLAAEEKIRNQKRAQRSFVPGPAARKMLNELAKAEDAAKEKEEAKEKKPTGAIPKARDAKKKNKKKRGNK